jgi:hypothetical protein
VFGANPFEMAIIFPINDQLMLNSTLVDMCRNIIVLVIISTFWASYGYRVLIIYRLAASVNLYLSLGVTCLMFGDIIITLGSCFGSRLLYRIVGSIS